MAAGAAFVAAVGLAYGFLPTINEVPKDFPATLVWEFRLSSLAVQVTLWTTFGLLFGHLAERLLVPRTDRVTVPAGTPAVEPKATATAG